MTIKANSENIDKQLTAISFFNGGGGMSLGFSEAGYSLLLANDIEPEAQKTHLINHKDIPFICKDISTIQKKEIFDIIGEKDIDVTLVVHLAKVLVIWVINHLVIQETFYLKVI